MSKDLSHIFTLENFVFRKLVINGSNTEYKKWTHRITSGMTSYHVTSQHYT